MNQCATMRLSKGTHKNQSFEANKASNKHRPPITIAEITTIHLDVGSKPRAIDKKTKPMHQFRIQLLPFSLGSMKEIQCCGLWSLVCNINGKFNSKAGFPNQQITVGVTIVRYPNCLIPFYWWLDCRADNLRGIFQHVCLSLGGDSIASREMSYILSTLTLTQRLTQQSNSPMSIITAQVYSSRPIHLF